MVNTLTFWREDGKYEGEITEEAYNSSVAVWIDRPNICFKPVSCAKCSQAEKIHDSFLKLTAALSNCLDKNKQTHSQPTNSLDYDVQFRKFVPRRSKFYNTSFELIVHDKSSKLFAFFPLNSDHTLNENETSYALQLKISTDNKDCIALYTSVNNKESSTRKFCHPTYDWLKDNLLENISKWTNDCSTSSQGFPVSHSLIDRENYAIMYEELKEKYGKKIAEVHICFYFSTSVFLKQL